MILKFSAENFDMELRSRHTKVYPMTFDVVSYKELNGSLAKQLRHRLGQRTSWIRILKMEQLAIATCQLSYPLSLGL